MSWQATHWALRQAPVGGDCVAKVILFAMSDYARPDGTGVFLSVATLMKFTGSSERTVRRKLAWLESHGIIRRGNQHLVDRIRADRRPVVWDLAMDVPRIPVDDHLDESGHPAPEATGCQSDTPCEKAGMKRIPRGVNLTPRAHGVSSGASRGVTGVRHGVSPVTPNELIEDLKNTPIAPTGGAADHAKQASRVNDPSAVDSSASPAGFRESSRDSRCDDLRRMWPKKSGNPRRILRLWDEAVSSVGADRVLASAKAYLKASDGVETRYLKGLVSWLSDPVCYAAASPASDSGSVLTPMLAMRQWVDANDRTPGVPSLYEAACRVREHPEWSAAEVPARLSEEFLEREAA